MQIARRDIRSLLVRVGTAWNTDNLLGIWDSRPYVDWLAKTLDLCSSDSESKRLYSTYRRLLRITAVDELLAEIGDPCSF